MIPPAESHHTRVDILAEEPIQELLPEALYSACHGLWVEQDGPLVRIICYPREASSFLELVRSLHLPVQTVTTSTEAPRDYAAEARKGFTPIRLKGITILPPWRTSGRPGARIVIDPGMAFGTGRHESTKLMLGFIRGLDVRNKRVLDLGCGSGILAIYARLRGAASVLAVDNDPLAAEAAGHNAALNAIDRIDVVCAGLEEIRGGFDLVLANLDFDTFSRHAPQVLALVRRDGLLFVSGIEAQFAPGLPVLFTGADLVRHRRLRDWHGYVFRRTSPSLTTPPAIS